MSTKDVVINLTGHPVFSYKKGELHIGEKEGLNICFHSIFKTS